MKATLFVSINNHFNETVDIILHLSWLFPLYSNEYNLPDLRQNMLLINNVLQYTNGIGYKLITCIQKEIKKLRYLFNECTILYYVYTINTFNEPIVWF